MAATPSGQRAAAGANHTLKIGGDGKVLLSGGYTYTSSTDYMGGQYRELGDGAWTYDVSENTWTGRGKGVPADTASIAPDRSTLIFICAVPDQTRPISRAG